MKQDKGLTIYLVFGGWGGIGIKWDMGIRICLGWIALGIIGKDIERVVGNIVTLLDKQIYGKDTK